MDELALRHGAAPQVHLKCCRQKGGADEGQSLPLLTLDRSRTRLLRNLLDNASRQSDPAGQPLQLRCTSSMLAGACWSRRCCLAPLSDGSGGWRAAVMCRRPISRRPRLHLYGAS